MMNRRHFLAASGAAAATSLLPSCSKDSGASKTLTVFTWADYLSDDAKASFEKKAGCKVVIDTFDSNEAMIAKLEAGATGYDLLVPSSYAVKQLQEKGMLLELDKTLLPNTANLDKNYLKHALDPGLAVSVPYMMAPTVLAYLSSKLPDAGTSWRMIGRPEVKGRVTLLDDMREVLGAALKALGHSFNSTVEAEVNAAADLAIQWKRNIAKFENEQWKSGIASGEFFMVHGYVGELILSREENEDIEIVLPEEGAAFSCDDLCIPKTAKEVALAHAFIDHLCDAAVAAENMEWIGYRAPNQAAYVNLSEDFRGSPLLFPPDELFEKCEPIAYLGDKLPLYTAAWDRVKNA